MPTTRAETSISDVCEQLKLLNSRVLTKSEFNEIIEEVKDGFKSMVDKMVASLREDFQKDLDAKDVIISSLSDRVAAQSQDIGVLHDKLAVVGSAISTIKDAQNNSEQYSRRHSLRLHGVPRKQNETSDDCLNTVKHIISEIPGLDIPDVVLDRAHRVGGATGTRPPPIIFKFTTWRHRTMFYRKRSEIETKFKWKTTLDITSRNIMLMDEVRREIEHRQTDRIAYVFCDVNCQPTMRTTDDKFIRFNSLEEALNLLEKEIFANPTEKAAALIERINKSVHGEED